MGSPRWQHIPPLERVWFASEASAQEAGYRRAASAWEPLDDFEIVGELGRGGTSVVYHGWDRGLGREVAIKVMQAHFGADPETALRFALEARLLASLRHPNIVSAFAVKQLPTGIALVMEYVRGRTLREVIQQEGRLAPERVERILRHIASALGAAHQHGIVHRDVKPDNIFLEESTGRALLADFGIAVNLENPSGLTMLGSALGTPNYMSPEQIDGGGIDGRSDLYSLALIGWEMLTGEKPWEGVSLYSVIYKQKHEKLPTLRRLRTDVPVQLARAIEGALAKDPAARWASADDFVAQFGPQPMHARWGQRWSRLLRRGRGAGRVPTASGRVHRGALEAARTIFFRPPADGAFAHEPPVRRRSTGVFARTALASALVLALLAVPAGLPNPFATSPRASEASADLPGSGSGAAPAHAFAPSALPDVPSPLEAPLLADSSGAPAGGGEAEDASPLVMSLSDSLRSSPVETLVDAAVSAILGATDDSTPPTIEDTTPPAVSSAAPPSATVLLPPARSRAQIAAGGMHTCEVDATQSVRCWGGNDRGQLGIGGSRRATSATQVPAVSGIAAVEAGGFHTCALRSLGTAVCWGENGDGQLGGGSSGEIGVVRISSHRFTSLSLGTAHSCGVGSDGAVYCWGSNANGQLGDGTSTSRAGPTRVQFDGAVAVLSAGWNHSCVVTRQGRGLCWGANHSGQLGDGTTSDRLAPVSIGGDPILRSIAAGSSHTCALTERGDALCWGQNSAGQLGDGTTTERPAPTRVLWSTPFVEVSAGGRHSCGLDRAGSAYCWGQNTYGQLGTGSTESRTVPTRVATDVRFSTIRSSGAHTCGLSFDGATYCWGYNIEGQVGDGTQTHRTTPQRVSR